MAKYKPRGTEANSATGRALNKHREIHRTKSVSVQAPERKANLRRLIEWPVKSDWPTLIGSGGGSIQGDKLWPDTNKGAADQFWLAKTGDRETNAIAQLEWPTFVSEMASSTRRRK